MKWAYLFLAVAFGALAICNAAAQKWILFGLNLITLGAWLFAAVMLDRCDRWRSR